MAYQVHHQKQVEELHIYNHLYVCIPIPTEGAD
jgi:hypothetical protein